MEKINVTILTEYLKKIGKFQLDGYKKLKPEEIEIKQEFDKQAFLTKYDTHSEKMVYDFVAEHYPNHSFLGEESGNTVRDPDIYWIVDPIDGTTNFTKGIPHWGISVGIWMDNDIQYGFIYFPVFDHMYFAERGKGAYLNDTRIQTSKENNYSRKHIVATMSETHMYRKLQPVTKHRILGSVIANMTGVATGKFLACFMKAKIWDMAAGLVIVEEAGGIINSKPDYHNVDLESYDHKNPPMIEIHAKANKDLPDFENILVKYKQSDP